jgi:hypothetical protein
VVHRAIGIAIEVLILAGVIFALLQAVRLTIFDLGLGKKYKNIITMFLVVIGIVCVVFFITHLISFYPTLPG